MAESGPLNVQVPGQQSQGTQSQLFAKFSSPFSKSAILQPEPMAIVGPLWVGPLHSKKEVVKMMNLAEEMGWIHPKKSTGKVDKDSHDLREILEIMVEESDPNLPPWYFHLDKVEICIFRQFFLFFSLISLWFLFFIPLIFCLVF